MDNKEIRFDCWLWKYGDGRGKRLFKDVTEEDIKKLMEEGWSDRPLPPEEVRKIKAKFEETKETKETKIKSDKKSKKRR